MGVEGRRMVIIGGLEIRVSCCLMIIGGPASSPLVVDTGRGGDSDARLEGGEGERERERAMSNGEVDLVSLFLVDLSRDAVRLLYATSRECCNSFLLDPDIAPLRVRRVPPLRSGAARLSLSALARPKGSPCDLGKVPAKPMSSFTKALLCEGEPSREWGALREKPKSMPTLDPLKEEWSSSSSSMSSTVSLENVTNSVGEPSSTRRGGERGEGARREERKGGERKEREERGRRRVGKRRELSNYALNKFLSSIFTT